MSADPPKPPVVIIGAGPSGLMAAEVLSAAGLGVVLYDQTPSPARKFLMAGRGGLNLTHSEDADAFLTRYGPSADRLRPMLAAFSPADLRAWADGLGAETFTGSSGRVFPQAMKASPLLRAWLARLQAQGVQLYSRRRWRGWTAAGDLAFDGEAGPETVAASQVVLALGGGSWAKLGSDGAWIPILRERGVALSPLAPANMGAHIGWSDHFSGKFAGAPLKSIAITFAGRTVAGEAMITRTGLEGGAIYAVSAALRVAEKPARLEIDLRPHMTAAQIAAKLEGPVKGQSISTLLRKRLNLSPAAIGLVRESLGPQASLPDIAAGLKALPLFVTSVAGIERAISSAGGVAWEALSEDLQLKALPGVFCIGEMLDWEAPTGGYLLQACFSTAVCAARAIAAQTDASTGALNG